MLIAASGSFASNFAVAARGFLYLPVAARYLSTAAADATPAASAAPSSGGLDKFEVQNRRQLFDRIAQELNITTQEQWYTIKKGEIERKHKGLLRPFNDNLATALETVYPELNWYGWMFARLPDGYWNKPENQRKYFDWLGKKLGIKESEQWYHIKEKEITGRTGGASLMRLYNNDVCKALTSVYPDVKWQPWRFEKLPPGFWEDQKQLREYVDWLGQQLKISTPEEWYAVNPYQVLNIPVAEVAVSRFGGLGFLLQRAYPETQFDMSKFSGDWLFADQKTGKPQTPELRAKVPRYGISQGRLTDTLRSILREKAQDLLIDYRHPGLKFQASGRPMEFDIFIPGINLAVEYQAEHHYHFHYMFGDPALYQRRDQEKRLACKEAKITLLEVPYWWDKTKESLQATLWKLRNDLVPDGPGSGKPIPENPPKRHEPHIDPDAAIAALELDPMAAKFPYRLTFGKKKGVPRCFGCKLPLRDPKKVRVEVTSTYRPGGQNDTPHITTYHFHASGNCIEGAIRRELRSRSRSVSLPPFTGEVYIPAETKPTEDDLKISEGLRFVRPGDVKADSAPDVAPAASSSPPFAASAQ